MYISRIQFETRFIPILDFKDKYKKILNPYLMEPNIKYLVANQGAMNEVLKLSWDESFYEIEILYDRVVFRYEGNPDDLIRATSVIKTFYEIVDKIKTIDTFQKIALNIMGAWAILPMEMSYEMIKEIFEEKFVHNSKDIISKATDYRIRLVFDDNIKFKSIDFGPYKPEDFKNYTFSTLNSEYSKKYNKAFGIMAITQVNLKAEKCKPENYKELLSETNAMLSGLGNKVEIKKALNNEKGV